MNALFERVERLERMRGREVVEVRPASGGFTTAIRVIVSYRDGERAFLKTAVDEETARWLHREVDMYRALEGASFIPQLLDAWQDEQEGVRLDAGQLLHLDVRSDNMCFVPRRGLVLVDWNWAATGEGRLDVGFWLPSLRLEGGPWPWEVLDGDREVASAVSGFFCSQAGLKPWPGGERVRAFQLAQARVAWRWAMRELGERV